MHSALSTGQSIPVISQKIFSYFFPCEFVSVPHLEVECFPKTSLSTGTVASVGNHNQKSFGQADNTFNSKFYNKVRSKVQGILLYGCYRYHHPLANIY